MKTIGFIAVAACTALMLIIQSGCMACRRENRQPSIADGLAAQVRAQLPSRDRLDAIIANAVRVERNENGFITELWLSENTTDADLIHLKLLPSLEHLSVEKSAVTDRGVVALEPLVSLTSLFAQETNVRGWGLSLLTQLKRLSLRDCRGITDDDLIFIDRLRELQGLNLSGTAITDSGLHHLSDLSLLEALFVGDTVVTGKAAEAFRRAYWPKMEVPFIFAAEQPAIRVTSQRPSRDALAVLIKAAERVEYDTQGAVTGLWASPNITDGDLIHLSLLPELRHLSLMGSRVTDRGIASLVALDRLTSLHVGETAIRGWGLSQLTSLKAISLRDCRQVTDDDLLFISRLRELSGLNLSGTSISDSGLRHLAELPRLDYLAMAGTQVTDTAAEAFRRVYWPHMEAEFGGGALLPSERRDDGGIGQ